MHRQVVRRAASFSYQFLICLAVDSGVAWSQTWVGLGTNDNWGTTANWNPNGMPANDGTASLVFAGTNRGSPFVNAPWNINGLVFNATAGTFAIGGNPLTIGAGGITNDSTNNLEQINNAIILGASQTWNAAGGNLSFGGAIELSGKLLTVDGSSNTTMGAAVKNAAIVKNGAGELRFSGNTDNVGLGLTVNSGAVVLDKTSTGSIHSVGGPGMTINGGTVQISNAANTGIDQIYFQAPVTINGGTFDFNGKVVEGFNSLNGIGGIITNLAASMSSTMVVGEANGSGSYLGSIQDGAGVSNAVMAVSKSGTGTQTLGGANTYTGVSTITGGTLRLASGTALGSTTGLTTVESAATLDLFGQAVGAEPLILNGAGVGGNGTLINSGVAPASLAGNITVSFPITIGGPGDITLSGQINGTNNLTKIGSGTLALSGNTNNLALSAIVNSGTLVLSKASSASVHAISGGFTLAGGNAQLGGTGGDQIAAANTVTVNSGTFDFNGRSEAFGGLNGSGGTITNSAASTTSTMTVGENDAISTYSGVIQDGAGVMALVKTGFGSLSLTGANTYSGPTTINSGSVVIAGGADNNIRQILLNSGALFLNKASTSSIHALADSGVLTIAGGTVVLQGTGGDQIPSTAAVAINGGTFDLRGKSEGFNDLNGSGGQITNFLNSPSTLTVGENNGGGTYSGTIRDSDGSLALIKTGSGTQTLNGATTNTGGTTINGGTLILGGSTDNGSQNVTVNSGTLVLAKASTASVHAVQGLTIEGGTAQLGGTGGDQLSVAVTVNSGVLDLNGRSESVLFLTGNGGTITNSAAGTTSTLTVGEIGTYLGVIQDGAGAMALTKDGFGTLSLLGANTYSGHTKVDDGTLSLGNGGSLSGAGHISIATTNGSFGSLNVNGTGAFITQAGASTLTVGSSSDTAGAATLNIGTTTDLRTVTTGTGTLTINKTGKVSIGSATTVGTLKAMGDVMIDGGLLELNHIFSVVSLAAGKTMAIQNGGRATFADFYFTNNAIYNISGTNSKLETTTSYLQIGNRAKVSVSSGGSLSSADLLDVVGGGSLVVDGINSSAVSGSSIQSWWGNAGTANVSFRNSATGTFNGGIQMAVGNDSTAFVEVLSDADLFVGGLILSPTPGTRNSATLNIDGSGSSVTLKPAANLTIGRVSNGSAVVNVQNGGALTVGDGGAATINPTGTLNIDGGTVSVGSLTNNGTFRFTAGTLTMTAGNGSFNGPLVGATPATTINVIANNVVLGSVTSFSGFSHQGTLNVGANTVTLNSATYARLGIMTSLTGGTIIANNGVTLGSGANLVGGGTVNARVTGEPGAVIQAGGMLTLGDTASPAGFNFGGELRVGPQMVFLSSAAQATLGNLTSLGTGVTTPGTLTANNGLILNYGNAIAGYGTISTADLSTKPTIVNGTVQGADATHEITFTGWVEGTMSPFSNNVNFAGSHSPGFSPTLLSIGNVSYASTATLIMELGGTTRGSQYDAIISNGQLALGGALQVVLLGAFSPAAGNAFDIFDWSSIGGTFASLNLPPVLGTGLMWNASQLYTTGVLSVQIVGDYNGNGMVDAADYLVWRKSLGQSGSGLAADGNGNGSIDNGDYTVWRSHFGQPAGSGSGAAANAAVPEPATLMLLMFAAAGWCGWRRRAAWKVPSTY